MKKHEKAMLILEREKYTDIIQWQEKYNITNKGASIMLGLSERQIVKIRMGNVEQNQRITLLIKLWGRILREIGRKEIKEYIEQQAEKASKSQKPIDCSTIFDELLKCDQR